MACLGLGLVTLTRSVIASQRIRLRFQRTLSFAIALVLYHLSLGFVLGYLQTNAGPLLLGAPWRALRLVYYLQTPIVLTLIASLLIRLFLLIQREVWRLPWLVLYWGAALFLTLLRGLDAASLLSVPGDLSERLSMTASFAPLLVPYGGLGATAWRARRQSFPHLSGLQARYLRWFGSAMLSLAVLTLAIDLSDVLVSADTSVLTIVPPLLFFGVCLLSGDRFVAAMFLREVTRRDPEESFESVAERYGISAREKQVIELICVGKTNKQIVQVLSISLPTVKDHISNIFQKTGVTNRVQLAALFHFDPRR